MRAAKSPMAYLAASAPKNICVRNRVASQIEMPIDSHLMIEEQLFISAVRHGHDVDVLEFRPCFAPVTVRQNMVTPDFAARFNFATGRHCPMKQCVESRDAHAARGRFHVLEKS